MKSPLALLLLLLAPSAPAPRPAPAGAAPDPAPPALYNQALAARLAGRPDEAAALLRRVGEPLPYESAFALGVLDAERGDLESARQEFARALRVRPGDAAALANLHWCNGRVAAAARPGDAARQPRVTLTPEQARRLLALAPGAGGRTAAAREENRW